MKGLNQIVKKNLRMKLIKKRIKKREKKKKGDALLFI
jgi:hypothetical protein